MEFINKTGDAVSIEDIDGAIAVVRRSLVQNILSLPPGLAVEMTNILRCLQQFHTLRLKLAELKKE